MSKIEPLIIWEKWNDPFGENIDNEESVTEEDEENYYSSNKKVNAILTPLGIIPYNEYTDCSKIFNFWTGHSNFDITESVAEMIEGVSGVETLDIFTRYRFRVGFGKAFMDRDVINDINTKIYEMVKINDPIARSEIT